MLIARLKKIYGVINAIRLLVSATSAFENWPRSNIRLIREPPVKAKQAPTGRQMKTRS